jgi:hypothetical protein
MEVHGVKKQNWKQKCLFIYLFIYLFILLFMGVHMVILHVTGMLGSLAKLDSPCEARKPHVVECLNLLHIFFLLSRILLLSQASQFSSLRLAR